MFQASPAPNRKLPATHRLALAALAVAGLLLLVIARNLEPDPRGFGTHEQLGFSPCYFQRWTGHRCPSCGATTAWAHALRGDVVRAAATNLGGAMSCIAVLVGVPWLLLTALWGRWMIVRPRVPMLLAVGAAWLMVVVLDWLCRWYLGR